MDAGKFPILFDCLGEKRGKPCKEATPPLYAKEQKVTVLTEDKNSTRM